MNWWLEDIEELQEAGFTVQEMNPWHFQVIGETFKINIWPTKKKYMIEYGDGAAYYTDVVEAVDNLLHPKKSGKEIANEMFEEMYDWDAVAVWRAGLKEFRRKQPVETL